MELERAYTLAGEGISRKNRYFQSNQVHFKKEAISMTSEISFGRYQVHFQHSNDKYNSILFSSDIFEDCAEYLVEQSEYYASISLPVFWSNGDTEIGYYSEIGKWGFRLWIVDSNQPLPKARDLSAEALDFDPEYAEEAEEMLAVNLDAEKAELAAIYANLKHQESLTVEAMIDLAASRNEADSKEAEEYQDRLALESAEEAESGSADFSRFSRFANLPSRSGLQALQLAAEILSAILQAENGYQPEASLASFQADLEEILSGNLWIDSYGIVWRFLQAEGYHFPSCTIEGSSVSAETLSYLQVIVRKEAGQLGSGTSYAEETEASLWEKRRKYLRVDDLEMANYYLEVIICHYQAIRLFRDYASRYSRYQPESA